MPKNKKKFISKKNAVTFQVVHRSQQDPLVADENAPQHVLRECSKKKNKEEEHKYGIFFDDEYDYMQHLKSVAELQTDWDQINYKSKSSAKDKKMLEGKTKVILPSSVFESEVEEHVGLLNKAAPIYGPRPELDPDIVAAMDDDFDYDNPENILEDNFIELANQEGESECSEEYDSECEDDVGSLDSPDDFGEMETKSRFTDYSMTSSVMRRNEQLSLLDDRFENMFKEYEDNEIGSLPCEEIEGIVSTQDEQLIKLAEKTLKEQQEFDINVKERTLREAAVEDSSEEELEMLVVDNDQEKWDCESILSTYSNIYNHPAKICEPKGPSKIKINKKTGMPMDVLGTNKLTAYNLSLLNECDRPSGPRSIISQISELSIRSKNETPEERRTRKSLLKEYRRERRLEKKANMQAFKEEKIRQEKIMLNVQNNQRGIKIL